jgi:cell division protein FtsW
MATIAQHHSFNHTGEVFYFGDRALIISVCLLLAFGLVMMTSASIEIASSENGDAFYYLKKQLVFMVMGFVAASAIYMLPLKLYQEWDIFLLFSAVSLLALVLVPGVGREVNGSTRWLNLGFMTLQASEPAKLFIVIFIAAYLSKYRTFVCSSWKGFVMPLLFVAVPIFMLLKEPDFGAVVVLMLSVFGMMFLAGVKLYQFVLLILVAGGGAAGLIFSSSYRIARVKSFLTAMSDPFNEDVVFGSGYQLAQALIAFGRGEWFGVGLGNSIQKLYFLPEAHTDFVLAIIAEELGVISVLLVLALFLVFIWRAMMIARKNESKGDFFPAYLAYGIALIFLGQVIINVGVNTGLLPTKGLTLPFLSAGGSSLITCMVMVAILLRIDIENHVKENNIKRVING